VVVLGVRVALVEWCFAGILVVCFWIFGGFLFVWLEVFVGFFHFMLICRCIEFVVTPAL